MSGLRNGDPKPGERVAVVGVGGLGHLALQLSKAVGLETFAITGQADKKAELVAFGADEVLLAGDDPGAALKAAGGADVILSTTNSAKALTGAGRRRRGRSSSGCFPRAACCCPGTGRGRVGSRGRRRWRRKPCRWRSSAARTSRTTRRCWRRTKRRGARCARCPCGCCW